MTENDEIVGILKDYSENTDVVNMAKYFQRMASKAVVVFLAADDLVVAKEQKEMERKLGIKFSKNLKLVFCAAFCGMRVLDGLFCFN